MKEFERISGFNEANIFKVEADPDTGIVIVSIVNLHDVTDFELDRVSAHRLGRFLMAYDRKAWEDD